MKIPIISDKRLSRKLKTKAYVYKTTGRPVLLYDPICWTVARKKDILQTMEKRMLREIRGVTLRNRLRSENIRDQLGVAKINEKVREG